MRSKLIWFYPVTTKIDKPIRKSKPIAEKEPNKLLKQRQNDEPKSEPVAPPPPALPVAPAVTGAAATAPAPASAHIVVDDMGNQSVVDFGDKVLF